MNDKKKQKNTKTMKSFEEKHYESFKIANLAQKIGLRVEWLINKYWAFKIIKNKKEVWLRSGITSFTNPIGMKISANKDLTKKLLRSYNIPVADGVIARTMKQTINASKKIGFPLVIKPNASTQGKGVCFVKNEREVYRAYKIAKNVNSVLLVEPFKKGDYFRFTIIDYKLISVIKAVPPFIIGDGKNNVFNLIRKKFNKKIKTTPRLRRILRSQGFGLKLIVPKNVKIYLSLSGSDGGYWKDETNIIHPSVKKLIEEVSRIIDLNIVGIDVLAKKINKNIKEVDFCVLEINAGPDLTLCEKAKDVKDSQRVWKAIVKMVIKRFN